jgi:hypothetical protein
MILYVLQVNSAAYRLVVIQAYVYLQHRHLHQDPEEEAMVVT